MVHDRKDLLEEDIAVAAHAELKPISRVWESTGHEHDEGVLRQALLARQAAELRSAQRDGWVPPLARMHTLLPCFAPPEGSQKGEEGGGTGTGTLSTAGSGLTTMDTEEGSAELAATAAAAAAALASQEEREAAAAAAAAAREARREARRADRERRRQQLLQVGPPLSLLARLCLTRQAKCCEGKLEPRHCILALLTLLPAVSPRLVQEKKEAKARARAEAQRRFADQQQRWEAAVADKRQQVAELQAQVRGPGGAGGAALRRGCCVLYGRHAPHGHVELGAWCNEGITLARPRCCAARPDVLQASPVRS